MGFIKNMRIYSAVLDVTVGMRKAIEREYASFGPTFTSEFIIGCIEKMYSLSDAARIGAMLPDEKEGQTEKERIHQLLAVFCIQTVKSKGFFPLNEIETEKLNQSIADEVRKFYDLCID